MKVLCETHAGISILNAISSGYGASMAIDLSLSVEVEKGPYRLTIEGYPSDDRLVKALLKRLNEELGIASSYTITVRSFIPTSQGLKSSSALSSALAKAIVIAEGLDVKDEELLRLACKASIDAGVSITGAYDDACASFFGGIVLTDNTSMKLLKRWEADESLVVLVACSTSLPKSKVRVEDYERLRGVGMKVKELVEDERFYEALTLNGMLTSAAQGYDSDLPYEAIKMGALAAGVTGTGPGIAILAEKEKELERLIVNAGYGLIRSRPINLGYRLVTK